MTVPLERPEDKPSKTGRRWRRFALGLLVAGGLALPVVHLGGWEAAAIVFGGVLAVAPKGRDDEVK
ncbi:hypothetical protein [Nocardia testacea]|uniref:hypothetical protein n=1 Tax=Nocardia testacea TaxID=248551 RepID=UPI0033C416A7